ncbi:MAG: hypothetical protein ACRDHW_00020 [Ktedonobacteraceae bacterium]
MLQLYHFHGEDMSLMYEHLNLFLQEMVPIAGVEIEPENIRADTKNYIQYDTSMTTLHVLVDFIDEDPAARSRQVAAVSAIYQKVTTPPVPEPLPVRTSTVATGPDDYDPFLDDDPLP